MSDLENLDDMIEPEVEVPIEETPKPVKKGPKGMRKSVPATPERLEILARAREKALAVRKAKAEASGKKQQREQIHEVAKQRKAEHESKMNDLINKRVEEELKKRVENINLERMEQLMDKKLSEVKPKRKPKKVIYESESETEDERVIVRRRSKKSEPPPPPPEPTPQRAEPPPQEPPPPPQPPINQYLHTMFNNIPMNPRELAMRRYGRY